MQPAATASGFNSKAAAVHSTPPQVDIKSVSSGPPGSIQRKTSEELAQDLAAIASLAAPLDNPASAAQSKDEILARIDAFVDSVSRSGQADKEALTALGLAYKDLSTHWRPDLTPEEQGSVRGADSHTLFGLVSSKLYARLGLATSPWALQAAVFSLPVKETYSKWYEELRPPLCKVYSMMFRIASELWSAWGGRTDAEKTASINACLDAMFDPANPNATLWLRCNRLVPYALMTALVDIAELGPPADRELLIKILASRIPKLDQAHVFAITSSARDVSAAFVSDLLKELAIETAPLHTLKFITFCLGDHSTGGAPVAWAPMYERISKRLAPSNHHPKPGALPWDMTLECSMALESYRSSTLGGHSQKPPSAQCSVSSVPPSALSPSPALISGGLPGLSGTKESKDGKPSLGASGPTEILPHIDSAVKLESTSSLLSCSPSSDELEGLKPGTKRKREE